MKKKYLLCVTLLIGLLLLLTVSVSAAEEDLSALKITPGRTVSVTLPEGVGNYTYNEEIVMLKGFSTDENGVTTLLFACRADIPMGTYDLLYINGESTMGISVYGMGDANMDGDVTARDVVLIKQAIVGMTGLSETQRVFSNVYDGDSEVNTRDAVLVLQHIVGMDVTLGTPDGDSAVCSGAKLEIVDGYLYATYLDAPETPVNLGKVKGEDGVGIASVEKTKSEGLVDTYTITYTNGNTATFTVTNGAPGANGAQGIQGIPGKDGHTPVITVQNGNWFVDGVDTGVRAEGSKGETGDDGLSAFEIYQKYHPEYDGTEQDWIDSLKGSDGAQGVGVVNAYINDAMHLILVLSNNLEIDAGYVGVIIPPDPITHTVIFVDYDGTILKAETVESGKNATAPTVSARENYRFVGWDKAFTGITADVIVTARYETLLPTVAIDNVTVSEDSSEVSFDVRIKNNPGIMNMILSVVIDDKIFDLKSAVKGDALPGASFTAPGSQATSSPYRFLLDAMDLTEEDKKDGVIFTVTLAVNDPTAVGEFGILLSYAAGDIVNEDLGEIEMHIESGKILLD